MLIALLRTLWRLSYEDMRDWLRDWPALALACGLPLGKDGHPRIPCPSQQCKRGQRAAAPLPEALFILTVLTALSCVTVGWLLASVTPSAALKAGVVVMAAIDAYLVFSHELQAPNATLIAAHPPGGLPRLQSELFGSVSCDISPDHGAG